MLGCGSEVGDLRNTKTGEVVRGVTRKSASYTARALGWKDYEFEPKAKQKEQKK